MNQDAKNTAEFVFLSTSLQEMNKDIAAASAKSAGTIDIYGKVSFGDVKVETDKGNTVQVDTLNRGGGRVVLRNAVPSLEQAVEAAKRLGIVMVEA